MSGELGWGSPLPGANQWQLAQLAAAQLLHELLPAIGLEIPSALLEKQAKLERTR